MFGIESGFPDDHKKKTNSDKLKNWNWENWKNSNILVSLI